MPALNEAYRESCPAGSEEVGFCCQLAVLQQPLLPNPWFCIDGIMDALSRHITTVVAAKCHRPVSQSVRCCGASSTRLYGPVALTPYTHTDAVVQCEFKDKDISQNRCWPWNFINAVFLQKMRVQCHFQLKSMLSSNEWKNGVDCVKDSGKAVNVGHTWKRWLVIWTLADLHESFPSSSPSVEPRSVYWLELP